MELPKNDNNSSNDTYLLIKKVLVNIMYIMYIYI